MLDAGGGRIVNISMNHSTMNRRGFVPYGPARAGAEALSRIMAADLRGTGITVNILLPGGATQTGMLPAAQDRPAQLAVIDPAVMGPPIVWLASPQARDVHDERIIATSFSAWRVPSRHFGRQPQLAGTRPCRTEQGQSVRSSASPTLLTARSHADERTTVPVDTAEGGLVVRLAHLLRFNRPDGRSSHIEWQPEGHRR
jgi:hypothetical protein